MNFIKLLFLLQIIIYTIHIKDLKINNFIIYKINVSKNF
jgi:hypothetical protein